MQLIIIWLYAHLPSSFLFPLSTDTFIASLFNCFVLVNLLYIFCDEGIPTVQAAETKVAITSLTGRNTSTTIHAFWRCEDRPTSSSPTHSVTSTAMSGETSTNRSSWTPPSKTPSWPDHMQCFVRRQRSTLYIGQVDLCFTRLQLLHQATE